MFVPTDFARFRPFPFSRKPHSDRISLLLCFGSYQAHYDLKEQKGRKRDSIWGMFFVYDYEIFLPSDISEV